MVKLSIPIHVMVGGRVVKVSIPATGHGRRQGGKITNTCYRSWQEGGW